MTSTKNISKDLHRLYGMQLQKPSIAAYYSRQKKRNANDDYVAIYNALLNMMRPSKKPRPSKSPSPLTNAERRAASAAVLRSIAGVRKRRNDILRKPKSSCGCSM